MNYLSQLADSGNAALKDGWPTPKPIGIASSSSSPRRRASGYRISRAAASHEYEKLKDHAPATYTCAEGPPGSKWNLAADTPPSKRVGRRRAYKRARDELEMLQREAQPKQKPVNTL